MVSAFGDRDALAAMPLFMIGVAKKEVIHMLVNVPEVSWTHGFEIFRTRYVNETKGFGIFELRYCLTKIVLGDWVIKFP